jgi:hypothetical protein
MSFNDTVSNSAVIIVILWIRKSRLVELKGLGRKGSLRASSEAHYPVIRLEGLGKRHDCR